MRSSTRAAALAVAAVLGGCSGESSAPEHPRLEYEDELPLSIVEVNAAGALIVEADGRAFTDGGLAMILIQNTSNDVVLIQSVRFESPASLKALVVGHSQCEGECIGAVSWDADAISALRRVASTQFPVEVPPGGRGTSLFVRLEVPGNDANTLARTCELRADAMLVELDDGRSGRLVGPGSGWVTGLNVANALTPKLAHCATGSDPP